MDGWRPSRQGPFSPDWATVRSPIIRFPSWQRPGLRLATRAQRREGAAMIQQFMREEEGQGLVEYALIIAIIAIAVIVAMIFLRDQISNIFSNIGNNLT
jgi:pilus assembly protein Flp/PilA